MHEHIGQIIFYAFAILAVLSALMVVTQNNPVRSVLFLVLTFFASAVLWIMVDAEFLALILLLVYVGAVMTLFLFVIMMLNIDIASQRRHFFRYLPYGLVVLAILVSLLVIAIPKDSYVGGVQPDIAVHQVVKNTVAFESKTQTHAISNTEALGLVLYTDYVFAFELAAVILLAAIVSAITLAHRHVVRSKRQDIVKQIMTNPKKRLELIRMKSEH